MRSNQSLAECVSLALQQLATSSRISYHPCWWWECHLLGYQTWVHRQRPTRFRRSSYPGFLPNVRSFSWAPRSMNQQVHLLFSVQNPYLLFLDLYNKHLEQVGRCYPSFWLMAPSVKLLLWSACSWIAIGVHQLRRRFYNHSLVLCLVSCTC